MNQFRPISLCNVAYKIVSKILCNKLKVVLPSLISDSQTTFVQGRVISDNILIAHEIMNSMKGRRNGKKGFMAVKLDMAKAYDRIEWSFLERALRMMGFEERWIRWIMKCVSSVSYSLMINNKPHGLIIPKRGLRQGDPLSPYLFVICSEILTFLLNEAGKRGSLTGYKVAKAGPVVTNLFFADDSLVFCRANSKEATELMSILAKYEKLSG